MIRALEREVRQRAIDKQYTTIMEGYEVVVEAYRCIKCKDRGYIIVNGKVRTCPSTNSHFAYL
jgi:hypothetical protein